MTVNGKVARGMAYLAALVWINLYICRDLFFAEHLGHMNSMHGFWMAMARLASHHWWRPGWWPYWDAGMPFEWTYAPLVPALTAAWAQLDGVSTARAFYGVMGMVYVLTPVTLFAMSARLTRSLGWSFLAAAAYSLMSPMQLLVPNETFAWSRIGGTHRLYLSVVWDELPHLTALTLLPLVALFMALALQRRRAGYSVAAGAAMALALLANAFAMTMIAIAMISLLVAFGRERWKENVLRVGAAGAGAYLVACPFLPPSLFAAIGRNQQFHKVVQWEPRSFTAAAIVALGCIVLWQIFEWRRADWWLRFLGYLAWMTTSIPVMARHLGRSFVPQPMRYTVEADLALALLGVFLARAVAGRWPVAVRAGCALALLGIGAEQVVSHRKFEKHLTMRATPESTIEYRVARWAGEHLAEGRIWLAGSMGQWFNRWSASAQMTGSSFSTAYGKVHQEVSSEFTSGASPEDAANVLTWLKAYGVQALAVPGKNSPEFWKVLGHPEIFAGCEVLWREDDTTICRVPGAANSLGHVVAAGSLVGREPRDWRDVGEARRYAAALDGARHASVRWNGTDEVTLRTEVPEGSAVSIQITHHPGWRATANGREAPVERDGLGLMWLKAPCRGPCEIRLVYGGGMELWLCRWVSALSLLALVAAWRWRRRSSRAPYLCCANNQPGSAGSV